jgi:hypothetical protein
MLTKLLLALSLTLLACDPDGLTVQSSDAGPCQSWHPVATEGTFSGREVCQDGEPVPPWTQLSGPCDCADGTPTGYYSSVNGVWYCLCAGTP